MKLLIVKLSSLGDLFHALPAVNALHAQLGACIHWVVQREYAELVGCFRAVERVIPFDRHGAFGYGRAFRRALRAERYDAVLDMQGLLKSALIARLSRADRRIGPAFQREGARLFYDELAGRLAHPRRHAVDEAMDMVRHFGVEPGPVHFDVAAPPMIEGGPCRLVRQEPELAAGPRIGLVPCSRWESKNWPAASFAALAKALAATGATLYIFGGAGDRTVCEAIAAAAGDRVVVLAGSTSLVQTLGYLAAMDLLIANDSGPVHMAVAVETPCLVLFGPTDPRRTGPYGERHKILAASTPCRPCYSRVCRRPAMHCMAAITVDDVLQAAQALLTRP